MIQFGTGGWRAIIADGFTKANLQLLTTALARKMLRENLDKNEIIIGYDRRFLSEHAARWAAEVMAGHGIFCHVIDSASPTPLIMHAVDRYKLSYGMAITASHNPADYNGIKVFMERGRDADEVLTKEIEHQLLEISEEDVRLIAFEDGIKEKLIEIINPMNQYVDDILDTIAVDKIREKNLNIIIDPMFGVSANALQTILFTARCHVDMIRENRDTLFGGRMPSPAEETLSQLITLMEEGKWDLGIATDGDADRLGIVDNKGVFLHPNKILAILYYYLLEYRKWKGPAVRNIATTHLLDHIAQDHGEICYEVPVGFKHVSSKMKETDAVIGGESSGGLTVRGHIEGKDGIYAAALIVEMLAVTNRTLSDLLEELETRYGRFEMIERNLTFTMDEKESIYNILMTDKKLPNFPIPVEKVSYMDGCKIYFKNGGWLIARFSGTEPLIRIFCEMESVREADHIADVIASFLGLAGL